MKNILPIITHEYFIVPYYSHILPIVLQSGEGKTQNTYLVNEVHKSNDINKKIGTSTGDSDALVI